MHKSLNHGDTKTRSFLILSVSVSLWFIKSVLLFLLYGVNLIDSVMHMPFCPSREHSVIVARSL